MLLRFLGRRAPLKTHFTRVGQLAVDTKPPTSVTASTDVDPGRPNPRDVEGGFHLLVTSGCAKVPLGWLINRPVVVMRYQIKQRLVRMVLSGQEFASVFWVCISEASSLILRSPCKVLLARPMGIGCGVNKN